MFARPSDELRFVRRADRAIRWRDSRATLSAALPYGYRAFQIQLELEVEPGALDGLWRR